MNDKSVSPHVGDEHWGKGGRFVVIDGKRVPAQPDVGMQEHPGTGVPMTPVDGDTLTDQPTKAKKGK
jgi:hypothetical protein